MKTTVYVVTHKKVDLTPLSLSPCYRLIRVGAYGGEPGPLLSDRTGENIAEKNANYCELTALYWIWKNDTASDVVGLCHYRRYFTTAKVSASPRHILTEAQITALMQRYDVVTSRKEYSYRGAYRAYLDCGRAKDVETTEQAIRTLCPEYLDAFRSEFLESAGGYPANMFLCRRPVLDAYCTWLFRILDYVEAHTDLTGYTPQEARIYGYLSERLWSVWLAKQDLQVRTMRILNTEETPDGGKYLRECCKAVGLEQAAKRLLFRIRK